MTASKQKTIPWTDCKIAFEINDDTKLWELFDNKELNLPRGCELVETDCSGGRIVAIFRIDNLLTISIGTKIEKELQKHKLYQFEGIL